jgi:hypothetical protein
MSESARWNFAGLVNCEAVEIVCEDAATALQWIEGPIDFLYLEAKDENNNSGYSESVSFDVDQRGLELSIK